jgi:hypothetical protein
MGKSFVQMYLLAPFQTSLCFVVEEHHQQESSELELLYQPYMESDKTLKIVDDKTN